MISEYVPQFRTIEEIALSASDMIRPPERLRISESTEKYRVIDGLPWSNDTAPYLTEPMDMMGSLEHAGMVFVGPQRTGKALALDTPIATSYGWTTMADIDTDDDIFDEQGKLCKVTGVTKIMYDHDCYRVTFSDGESLVADGGHKWQVLDIHRPNKRFVMTTEELVKTHKFGVKNNNRYRIDLAKPLQMPDVDLPLDPYVLGVWLGDGHTAGARIFCGNQDVNEMNKNLLACGIETRLEEHRDANWTITLSAEDGRFSASGRGGGSHGMNATLRSMNLGKTGLKKYIPKVYLRASERQRMSLLQGLMDTDGHADVRGQAEFCTTSVEIMERFAELLTSLSYKYCLVERAVDEGALLSHRYLCMKSAIATKTSYRFMFYVRPGDIIFRLGRKQERIATTAHRRSLGNDRRSIVSIEKVSSVPVRCIQVDSPSHLFLAGRSMIPTHNSEMFLNWLTHTEKCDPADMMVVDMTRTVARDWSNTVLKRYFNRTKIVGERVLKHNVHDVTFRSGMSLLIKWPAITELSGKTIPRLFLRDYDRMPVDVDGEGNAFDLTQKRAESFRRFGMCVAESSPGFEVEDPKWVPSSPHEAPPARGILELYNRGDRRRWYWKCPNCQEAFQPEFRLLKYPASKDHMEAAEQVTLPCPYCGFEMLPAMKSDLNRGGMWLREGQRWNGDGTVSGRGRVSDIASFWMFGPAALYQKWSSLVLNYLRAMEAYEKNGDVGPLKKTMSGDQAIPFLSPELSEGRMPDALADRAEDWGGSREEPVVPAGVRFLVATVDVQAGSRSSFVVQVHGIAPGRDVYFVDMFKIRKSERLDEHGERIIIDPAGYVEDWQVLVDQVIEKTYPLADGSGRRMQIKITGCDSGGEAGVTPNAIIFWRWLRDNRKGYELKFQLIKPHGNPKVPRYTINYVDSARKDRHSGARGDVPFLMLNSNLLKDQISNMLGRTEPGNGMVHFPYWAPTWLYSQLTSEVRTAKGWEKPSNRTRNEAFDLFYYAIGVCLTNVINVERMDWDKPPRWAAEWNRNELVIAEGATVSAVKKARQPMSLAKIAEEFA